MITLTPTAIEQIKKIQSQEQKADAMLRIGIKAGGCSGFEYVMGFDDKTREADQVFEQAGIKIVIDGKSHPHVDGTSLDFQGGLGGTGFTFNNPKAKGTCGCGTSFQV